jgi:hypothetical protein
MLMFTHFNPVPTLSPASSASSASSASPASTLSPALFNTWSGVAGLYQNAMQASAQQWMTSSAGIIQQHTLQAFANASRACADALAKNAVSMQQKSMERFVDANQKAVGMIGQALTDAWMGSMRPRR